MPRRALVVVALAAAACGSGAPDSTLSDRSVTSALLQDRRAELFAADAAHTAAIAELGPIDGLLRALRGNAVYLAAGIDIVRGTHDLRAALVAANPDPDHTHVLRTLAGGDVSADGNFGFTFGWLTRTAPEGTTYGAYVAVWERGDGDDFRVTAYYTRSSPFPHIPPREGFPLFLNGPGAGGVPHAGGVEEHRRSVVATDEAFAALCVDQGSSIAFPAYANSDFLMVFGRNFVGLMGQQEIADAYAASTPGEVLDWRPLYVGAAASGDLAFTVGNAVDTLTTSSGDVLTGYSKYLTLWARTADGTWRFIADGGAPSPAPGTEAQP